MPTSRAEKSPTASGKAKAITNFAEYRETVADVAEEPVTVPAVATRPPQRRYIAFFVDRLNLREKINREEFGLLWNHALEAGGLLVSPDVKIEVESQFVKAA